MYVLTPEATAWMRAASEAGAPLPADVIEARDVLAAVEAEMAALPRPEAPPTAAQLVADGTPLAKAQTEAEKLARKAEKAAEFHSIAAQGRGGAIVRLNRAVAAHRDELIVGSRPVVNELIEMARPHAQRLFSYAPGYSANEILRRGDAGDLEAFQAAAVLERAFGHLAAACRSSFVAAVKADYSRYDVRWTAQVHRYWARPENVVSPRMAGTFRNRFGRFIDIAPSILAVASEPAEAEFRFAVLDEMKAVYEAGLDEQTSEGPKFVGARSQEPAPPQRRVRFI
jgi:hypothetical protein